MHFVGLFFLQRDMCFILCGLKTYLPKVDWVNHVVLCVFFWVIPRLLNFIYRRIITLCLFHLHGQVGVQNSSHTYPPMKMEQSVPKRQHKKIQTPENCPEESIQHSGRSESLKWRIFLRFWCNKVFVILWSKIPLILHISINP